jgi:diadenosine tetraphosphate (Ap4A) HIT family hydrolase
MDNKELEDCLFCKIAKEQEPSYTFYEDSKHLAFLSIFPNTKGFTVLITKNHFESNAFNLEDEILKDLIVASKKVANILVKSFDDVERCGLIIEGYGINHLHAKIVPLHGTTKGKKWTSMHSNIKTYFETYQGYLSSNDSKLASSSELEELRAILIRQNY